jgi:hypothetical protein
MKTFKNANGWSRNSGSVIIRDSKPNPKTNESRCRRLDCGFGSSDSVSLFQDERWLIVLTKNRGLRYCGVNVFDATGASLWDMFMQNPDETPEDSKAFDGAEINLVKYLLQWWND